MVLALLIALQVAAVAEPADRLAARFPPAWRLPLQDQGGKDLPNARFEAELIKLVETPLAAADPATKRPALMFGDLLARSLEEAEALVPAASWPRVRALLDRRDARAGFLMGETWELPAGSWPSHDGGRDVEQCAVFIAADLASIKICECDYARWLQYRGNSYESVTPVAGSHFFAQPSKGPRQSCGLAVAAAVTFSLDLMADLPFPFGGYEFRLHSLTGLDGKERPRTWVYSDSPSFHWLAGSDLFVPVLDGAGKFTGTLVIREAGADLDGVPDKSSHRQDGMRVALGGLRRDAEAHFKERKGSDRFPPSGAVPVCSPLVPAP